MKKTHKILRLTLAVALAVSTMLVALPIASATPETFQPNYEEGPYQLSLSMTVDKASAAPGETVKYIISLTNNSYAPVVNVKFSGTAKLVNGFTPILTMPEQTLDFGDFAPGQTKSLTYTQVIPSTATDGQFFDNFGSAVGIGLYLPSYELSDRGVKVTSNDASARTIIRINVPEETTPTGETLVVTGEAEATVLPIALGMLLLLCGIVIIAKSRRVEK